MKLIELLSLLRSATTPADVFGMLTGEPCAALKRRYHELVLVAHPDHNQALIDEANEALKRLHGWYASAQDQVARGVYGRTPRITATTRLHTYAGYASPLRGDVCDLFPVDVDAEQVLLKVTRHPRNNDLLRAEAQTLRRIGRELEGQPVHAHFPTLVEHFLLPDATGTQRHTNVLRVEADTVSLAEVVRAYPAGLNPADAAWIFNRILAALGVAHNLGIVHGAVLPAHVLIRPADHNGVLIDWCYSVQSGEPLKAISQPYASDYPPEVQARQAATPATDLYMGARCMLWLLGGGGEIQRLPSSVPKPIVNLLRGCLLPSPQRRAANAWQLLDDFHEILGEIYGPPVFRPFVMPSI